MGYALVIRKLASNETQLGLLALSPFFLIASSLLVGFEIAILIVSLLILLSLIVYFFGKFFPVQQRLVALLIISTSVVLVVRMLLQAEAYSLTEDLGLFLPLIIINSLVLSTSEKVFSMQDLKTVFSYIFSIGVVILIFFILVGFSREVLNDFSIINSPAACFILTGCLFAIINVLKGNTVAN